MTSILPEAPRPALRRRLKRAAAAPLVPVAILLVLFDDAFRVWVKPAVARLARFRLLRRIEAWIAGLPPYGIVTLFIVPLLVIEPMKIAGLYFIGTGHLVSGILTFVAAKIIGIGLAERLFAIGRDKLLSIGWFRWAFERAVRIKDSVHAWLAAKAFWRAALARVASLKAMLVRGKASLAAWRAERRTGRWSAARRLAGGLMRRPPLPNSGQAAPGS